MDYIMDIMNNRRNPRRSAGQPCEAAGRHQRAGYSAATGACALAVRAESAVTAATMQSTPPVKNAGALGGLEARRSLTSRTTGTWIR
jgi:hypothetical protein